MSPVLNLLMGSNITRRKNPVISISHQPHQPHPQCLAYIVSLTSLLIPPVFQHILFLPLLSHLLIYSFFNTSNTHVPTVGIFYLPSLQPQFFFLLKKLLVYSLLPSDVTFLVMFPWLPFLNHNPPFSLPSLLPNNIFFIYFLNCFPPK